MLNLFRRTEEFHAPMQFNTVFPRLIDGVAAAPAAGWVKSHTIPMRSGARFDFSNPEAAQWRISDVAYSLALLTRFTGHARSGYSVAQHSVLASYLVPPEFAYDALHHDGHECVVGDCASPLKRLLPDYQKIEHAVCNAYRTYFGCSLRDVPAVKRADMIMLSTEFRDVMPNVEPGPECADYPPMKKRIWVWPAWYAAWRFRRRHCQLVGLRVLHEMSCC